MLSLYLVLWLISLTAFCKAECPNGFTKHGSSCYKAVKIEATYADAEVYCRAVDTNLMTIDSAEEQAFLEGYLQQSAASYSPHAFWVGGNDIQEEHSWMWSKTGLKFSSPEVYTNWADGQPDNEHNHEENCLEITEKFHYKWNDNACDNHIFFICEKDTAFSNGGFVIG